jgi:hypothetical protein
VQQIAIVDKTWGTGVRSMPEIPAFFYGFLIRGMEGEEATESAIFGQQNNCWNQHFSVIDQILINFSKFPVAIRFNRLFFMRTGIQKTHFSCSIPIPNLLKFYFLPPINRQDVSDGFGKASI